MAKHKYPQKNGSSSEKWKFKGFHNVTLTDSDKEEFNSWYEAGGHDVRDALVVCSEEGFKISFSFDDWRNAYCYSVTGKKSKTPLDGYCCTFYHIDAQKAILLGSWYLRRMIDSEQWPILGEQNEHDW